MILSVGSPNLKTTDKHFVVHHLCILAVWWSCLEHRWGHLFCLATVATEFTGLFVNVNYFLNASGMAARAPILW